MAADSKSLIETVQMSALDGSKHYLILVDKTKIELEEIDRLVESLVGIKFTLLVVSDLNCIYIHELEIDNK